MAHKAKKYIYDMIKACQLIEQFARGKTIDQYMADPLLHSAVERQFLIIGEALQQLHGRFPEIAQSITEHRSIINFRHILVHGYDEIDDDIVWGIIKGKLSTLQAELETLLSSL